MDNRYSSLNIIEFGSQYDVAFNCGVIEVIVENMYDDMKDVLTGSDVFHSFFHGELYNLTLVGCYNYVNLLSYTKYCFDFTRFEYKLGKSDLFHYKKKPCLYLPDTEESGFILGVYYTDDCCPDNIEALKDSLLVSKVKTPYKNDDYEVHRIELVQVYSKNSFLMRYGWVSEDEYDMDAIIRCIKIQSLLTQE